MTTINVTDPPKWRIRVQQGDNHNEYPAWLIRGHRGYEDWYRELNVNNALLIHSAEDLHRWLATIAETSRTEGVHWIATAEEVP